MRNLITKAKDNHGHTYDVMIKKSTSKGFEGKEILQIKGTPGNWYMETLMARPSGSVISLDFGQNWNCINFDEIMAEAMEEK